MIRRLQVLEAPTPLASVAADASVVFLAGSIEQGEAPDWQAQLCGQLSELPLVMLNPRRASWDASWIQSLTNPRFVEQVEWELAGLERADLVVMYFAPTTRAPITLLELGLVAHRGGERVVVCCPEGYWRKGNVDVVCRRYGVAQVATLEELAEAIRARCTRG